MVSVLRQDRIAKHFSGIRIMLLGENIADSFSKYTLLRKIHIVKGSATYSSH